MQRYNSRGKLIESRHGITRVREGVWACNGCGREFGDFDGTWHPYSLANSSGQLRAFTLARAHRHADHCKAPTIEERKAVEA